MFLKKYAFGSCNSDDCRYIKAAAKTVANSNSRELH